MVIEFPKYTKINNNAINFVKEKQQFYGPIYSFGLVKLENLKTYIESHLKPRFISLSMSPANALIFFNKK